MQSNIKLIISAAVLFVFTGTAAINVQAQSALSDKIETVEKSKTEVEISNAVQLRGDEKPEAEIPKTPLNRIDAEANHLQVREARTKNGYTVSTSAIHTRGSDDSFDHEIKEGKEAAVKNRISVDYDQNFRKTDMLETRASERRGDSEKDDVEKPDVRKLNKIDANVENRFIPEHKREEKEEQ